MERKQLYIDFDGVIMDTINVTYRLIEEQGVNKTEEEVQNFYRNLNWKNLLSITPEISDAFNCIQKLKDSDLFDISILTHVNSLDEAVAKINYIRKYVKEVTIIPVPREISKTKMCKIDDSILVDDYSGNLKDWVNAGGIGIQF